MHGSDLLGWWSLTAQLGSDGIQRPARWNFPCSLGTANLQLHLFHPQADVFTVVEPHGHAGVADLVSSGLRTARRTQHFAAPTQCANAEPRIAEYDPLSRFQASMDNGHHAEVDRARRDGEMSALGVFDHRHPFLEQRLDVAQANFLVADISEIDDECDGLADLIILLIAATEGDACLQSVRFFAPGDVVLLWGILRSLRVGKPHESLGRFPIIFYFFIESCGIVRSRGMRPRTDAGCH